MGELLEGYKGVVGFETSYTQKDDWPDFENFIETSGLLRAFQWLGATLCDKGWTPKNAGNMSTVMLPGHHWFYITRSGGNLSNLKAKDIVYVAGLEVGIGNSDEPYTGRIMLASTFPYSCDLSLATVTDTLMKQGILDKVIEGMGLERATLDRHSFNLKKVLRYLGSRDMIKCFAEVIAKDEQTEPSSETFLHGLIYSRRIEDRATAIVHCHAEGIVEKPSVYFMPETDSPLAKIGYGSLELAVEAVEQLGRNNFVLLRGHGPVVVSTEYHWEKPEGYMHVFRNLYKTLVESERYSKMIERWPDNISELSRLRHKEYRPDFLGENTPLTIPDDIIIRMIRQNIQPEPGYYREKHLRELTELRERMKRGISTLELELNLPEDYSPEDLLDIVSTPEEERRSLKNRSEGILKVLEVMKEKNRLMIQNIGLGKIDINALKARIKKILRIKEDVDNINLYLSQLEESSSDEKP